MTTANQTHFSPPPWESIPSTPHEMVFDVVDRDGHYICIASSKADALLISQAPELLSALEGLVSDWERVVGPIPLDHEARAAIQRAKGGE